jgi:hypothetical protein
MRPLSCLGVVLLGLQHTRRFPNGSEAISGDTRKRLIAPIATAVIQAILGIESDLDEAFQSYEQRATPQRVRSRRFNEGQHASQCELIPGREGSNV